MGVQNDCMVALPQTPFVNGDSLILVWSVLTCISSGRKSTPADPCPENQDRKSARSARDINRIPVATNKALSAYTTRFADCLF